MSDGHGIPASWYPDPADARKQRYWDGSGWTQQVRDAALGTGIRVPDLTASVVNDPLTDFTGYDRIGQSASYVPFSRGGAPAPSRADRTTTGGPSTIAIWLYAFVPLLVLLHLRFSWDFSVEDLKNLLIHGGLGLGTVVLAILLAAIDRSQLQKRGYEHTPPAFIGLLPPIHILVRLFTTRPVSVFVTLVSLVVQGVVIVVLVTGSLPAADATDTTTEQPIVTDGMTAPFTEQQLAYLLTAQGMEEKIRFDATESSLNYETVVCAPLASTDLGSQTTCVATARLADYDLVIQVLPNGDNVPFAVVSVTPVFE